MVRDIRLVWNGNGRLGALVAVREDGRFRAVAFKELAYLPIEARDDPDLLGKQWAAVRGLYDARVDFVYAAMGAFAPRPLGVVQFYGAAAEAETEAAAVAEARRRLRAVEAVLANFPQSRLRDPDTERLQLLVERLGRLPRLLAVLGHPDPRESRRGLGRDGSMGEADEDLASQQNELLFRGLARLREDFVFLVTAAHVGRGDLTAALARCARFAAAVASRRRGAISVGFSLAVPIAAALASSWSGQRGRGETEGRALSEGASETWSRSHTDSFARTTSHTVSQGGFEAEGIAHTTGVSRTASEGGGVAHTDSYSWGRSHTEGTAVTDGWASTSGTTRTTGTSVSQTVARAEQFGAQVAHTSGVAASGGWSASVGGSEGTTVTQSESHGVTASEALSVGSSYEAGVGLSAAPAGIGINVGGKSGGSMAYTAGLAQSQTQGTAVSQSSAATWSRGVSGSLTASSSATHGVSHAVGVSVATTTSTIEAVSHAQMSTVSHAETRSVADTVSEAWGRADTTSRSWGKADTTMEATTVSRSWGRTWGEAWGEAATRGQADTEGYARSRMGAETRSAAAGTSWGGGSAAVGALSAGLVPGVSISRTWNTEDDLADRLAEIARQVESLLNRAAAEGGFLTSVYLAVGEEGARAARALIPQAFHGPDVPTPVLTVEVPEGERERIRRMAMAFLPSLEPEPDPFGAGLWTRYGTLLTAGQLAAYTAPGLFEEGTAVTVQERIPPLAFYPEMEGDAVLGFQVSPETGEVTGAPVRLSFERHFHTAFLADTGFGKTVAAMRLAYETARWGIRTVVLDFGAGWRSLLNAPGMEGKVDIRQLSPGGPRPLRWNPLAVGRHIPPELHWRAFCDIFAAVARLGVRRQIGELREALRRVYLRAGVLVDDPDVRADPEWGRVRPEEGDLAPPGTPLGDLPPPVRQALAVRRSRRVGLADLYREVEERLSRVPPRDATLRGVLEGILYRLHPLVQGAAAAQYAPGEDALDVAELVPRRGGITVLEGGAFLDEFSKAFLLGWAAWQIYTDAVLRRIRRAAPPDDYLQIFFEEANKILSGVDAGEDDEGGAAYTAEQFAHMWRDSRKYGVWLHVISQTPSRIPPGILSSCNNLICGQLKNPRDRDLAVAAIARSEKGFVDEVWRRFLASLPIGRMVGRLGYARDRAQIEPFLFEPLPVAAAEPSDEEIEAKLGRLG